jgi:hypothetical protein
METQTQTQNIKLKKNRYLTTIRTENNKIMKLGYKEVKYLINIYKFQKENNRNPFMYADAKYINSRSIISGRYLSIYTGRIFRLVDKGLLERKLAKTESGHYAFQLSLTPLGIEITKILLSQS